LLVTIEYVFDAGTRNDIDCLSPEFLIVLLAIVTAPTLAVTVIAEALVVDDHTKLTIIGLFVEFV
jgi:hypothetical protein